MTRRSLSGYRAVLSYSYGDLWARMHPGSAWKAGQDYRRNPIDWLQLDGMHDHHMIVCMQSYMCLVLISVRDKVMVAGYFTLETSLIICNTHVTNHPQTPNKQASQVIGNLSFPSQTY